MVIPNDARVPFDKSTFYEIYGFKVEGRGQILHGEAAIEYCARLSPSQTNTEEPRYQATQGMSTNLDSGHQLAGTGGQGGYQGSFSLVSSPTINLTPFGCAGCREWQAADEDKN